jgi:ubiquinol-cytochrome c reductase core subunit 2
LDYDALQTSSVALALNAVHTTAFHHGLGAEVIASPTIPVKIELVRAFANSAYSKANLVLVASGANAEELTPQLQEFWKDLPTGELLTTRKAKVSPGETRISHRSSSNAIAIAFPGSSLYSQASPELVVLSHLLGGFPRVKWSKGQSALAKIAGSVGGDVELVASNIAYSDAGLFTILALGPSYSIGEATSQALKLLRDIAKGSATIKPDELKRAVASARYATYAAGEPRLSALESIGQAVLDTGKAPDYDSIVAEFNKVTSEKVQKVKLSRPFLQFC